MPVDKCLEYSRLETEVEAVLRKLTEITQGALVAFRANNQQEAMRLDKELELTVGLKERTIGALRQHAKEHHCWPPH